MTTLLRPLRIRLAIAGFAAIYVPVLILFSTFFLTTSSEVVSAEPSGIEVSESGSLSPWVILVIVLLVPVAAGLAWWWSGRAVRPVAKAITVQQELVDEASHELRTPLSTLSTNAEVLLAHPNPTMDDYRRGLERSGTAARRMGETLDSLLINARGESRTIAREPIDLASLVQRSANLVEPLATQRGLELRIAEVQALRARVDSVSVERAVSNLLTNAIEHSPRGGVISVNTEPGDGEAVITVTDAGPGIPPEDHDKIFERYWRGESANGSGIGLAVVRQVATAHGGSVEVESPVDGSGGARFVLRLAI